jgi:hypothetical protein
MLHAWSIRTGALALGVAGLVSVGAVVAVAARSAAPPFQLILNAKHEEVPSDANYPLGLRHAGTFTSRAPFCESGSAVDLRLSPVNAPGTATRLLTCADGSGTLTALVGSPQSEHQGSGTWSILGGAGRYAGLRGRGTYRSDRVNGDPDVPATIAFRSTWKGIVDADSVAPSIAIPTATATRLRPPSGAYALKLVVALRDDVEGNPVSYTLRVTAAGVELARKFGTAQTATLPLNVRIRPSVRVTAVRLQLSAADPVGNEATTSRSLRLPR